jgi:hypothetical protein
MEGMIFAFGFFLFFAPDLGSFVEELFEGIKARIR